MDDARFERIMSAPDRATMDDVTWLCRSLMQLRVDYADEKARCFKVEMQLDECRERLARANHRAVAWSRQVPR